MTFSISADKTAEIFSIAFEKYSHSLPILK
jgi:hypothetical protein